jgi:hypothetical protein
MAFKLNDRVKVNSTATGTSQTTFAIDNTPVTGFETFNTGIGVGNTTYYCIFNQGTSEFEVGLGTLSSTTNLQRTTIISSSNSDSVVDFQSGTKDVFCTLPASKAVFEDASNNVSLQADLTVGTLFKMPDNTSGKILVGDGTSYQEVAVSGDATLASNGALTVTGGVSAGFVVAMSIAL